jgi:hypothetical protein
MPAQLPTRDLFRCLTPQLLTIDGPIATITLNRPEAFNS